MDTKDVLLQRFTDFLLKIVVEVVRLCMVIQLRQTLLPLADEFHKTIIKKFKNVKYIRLLWIILFYFVDNSIRDTQLISKYNKGFCF